MKKSHTFLTSKTYKLTDYNDRKISSGTFSTANLNHRIAFMWGICILYSP